jgi:hypothetical protein
MDLGSSGIGWKNLKTDLVKPEDGGVKPLRGEG